jgi:uncharacterized protein (DUF2236 family)
MTIRGALLARQSDERTAFRELLTLLFGAPSAVRDRGVLTDSAADPGLFGPQSVTWWVVREPLLLASGSRALLMQLAHPLVAQGVADHSRFETTAFARGLATVRWIATVVFGTTAEATAAVAALREVHERVRGRLDSANATPSYAAGAAYSALDPAVGLWVHATLVDSMLCSYEALIGGLSRADADRFVREWNSVARLLGVLPDAPWRGRRDLDAYLESQLAGGWAEPVPAAVRAAHTVLAPPLPWAALGPVTLAVAFLSTGSLDARLRGGYGLPWSPAREALYRCVCAIGRLGIVLLPRRLRVSPLYHLAWSRSAVDGNLTTAARISKHRT